MKGRLPRPLIGFGCELCMGLMGLTPLLVYKFGRPQVRVLPSAPLIPLQMGMWRFLGLKPSAAPGVVLPAWAQTLSSLRKGLCFWCSEALSTQAHRKFSPPLISLYIVYLYPDAMVSV